MASSYGRRARTPDWLRHRFAYPDRSGLRTALLVSMPISVLLWIAILAALAAL